MKKLPDALDTKKNHEEKSDDLTKNHKLYVENWIRQHDNFTNVNDYTTTSKSNEIQPTNVILILINNDDKKHEFYLSPDHKIQFPNQRFMEVHFCQKIFV